MAEAIQSSLTDTFLTSKTGQEQRKKEKREKIPGEKRRT
jgi:hypothetical protein